MSTGIEMFHKTLDEACAGDQMGILLRGVKKDDVRRGMCVAKPGTVKQFDHFEAQVTKISPRASISLVGFYFWP